MPFSSRTAMDNRHRTCVSDLRARLVGKDNFSAVFLRKQGHLFTTHLQRLPSEVDTGGFALLKIVQS